MPRITRFHWGEGYPDPLSDSRKRCLVMHAADSESAPVWEHDACHHREHTFVCAIGRDGTVFSSDLYGSGADISREVNQKSC